MRNHPVDKLVHHNWYWSKSLKKGVKFVEVCRTPPHKDTLYVEFNYDGLIGGAHVPFTDLYESTFDAALDSVYEGSE